MAQSEQGAVLFSLSHFLTVQFHFLRDLLPQLLFDMLPAVFLSPQIVPEDLREPGDQP